MQLSQAKKFATKLVESNGVCNRQGGFKYRCLQCPIINTSIYRRHNTPGFNDNMKRHICTSKITLDWATRYLGNIPKI